MQELPRQWPKERSHDRNFNGTVDILALLKTCAKQKNLREGTRLHAFILARGLIESNCYIASNLVNMYAKCGAMAKAAQILDELPVRDVVCWSALIAGYVEQGQAREALKCFERMQREGLCPDAVTFICILKACGGIGVLSEGTKVHLEIIRCGLLGKDIYLGAALVDMYAKCGELEKAQQVLEQLPARNVVTWNALITGYVQCSQNERALECYEMMQHNGVSPNTITLTCALKACGSIGAFQRGSKIHDEIVRNGLLVKDTVLGTALLCMYTKCGALAQAAEVLEMLPIRNAISWNALITGYTEQGEGKEALKCFRRLLGEGISPNTATFSCIVKACGSIKAFEEGKKIHSMIIQNGVLGKDPVLANALVDMYASCAALGKAAQLLDELPMRDVITWTSLIVGYAKEGLGQEAIYCLECMQLEGLSPDPVTFICILKAISSQGAADKGEHVQDEIVRQGLLGKDTVLGITLVDMYAKCGALLNASQVFDNLPIRDLICWNALIAGYAQQRKGEEAMKCFDQMKREGFSPDTITFTCMLKACASIGASEKGEQIHVEILRNGLLGTDVMLSTALVDMYVKCGDLSKAAGLLSELPSWDVVAWSILIVGYGQQGWGEEALNCFEWMQGEGFSPNEITCACVLDACSRSGLLDAGQKYFLNMSARYGLLPDVEHYNCMVDLFARHGECEKALAVIQKMPFSSYLPVWLSLLDACRQCGNVELGRFAFDNAVKVDKNDSTSYILMAKIYAAAGMKEDAITIEAMGRAKLKIKLQEAQDFFDCTACDYIPCCCLYQ